MNTSFLIALLIVINAEPQSKDREPHPLAPSLPRLTKAEEEKIERTIDRFIRADVGTLKGAEAKKALDDFNKLGREATFQLIDGLNRGANLESSCPAVIIAKRLASIILTTNDMQLLTFAKENIGAGVTAKRHLNVLHDLQTQILLRRGVLQRQALASKAKSPSQMSLAELEKAVAQNGTQLQAILLEAEKRQGMKAVDLLLMGIANSNAQIAKLSEGLLTKNLNHQSGDVLKALLRHNQSQARSAAANAIGAKKLRYGKELIDLLQDDDAEVRQAARRALVQISGGINHGPAPDASIGDREAAVLRWRGWWSTQKK